MKIRTITSPDTEGFTNPGESGKTVASSSESTTDKIAEIIANGIRSGVFVPGQHLLEPDLTRRLGTSRNSLREALRHLAAAGSVTLNRYRGAHIGILDRRSALDLLDTLEPLTRLAARLAARNCTAPDNRNVMLDAAARIEAAGKAGNRGQFLQSRRHFYETVIDLGGNRELARAMPLSRSDLFRAQVEVVLSDEQRRLHILGYWRIADAIAGGNSDDAETAVQQHFNDMRGIISGLRDDHFPHAGI